MFLSDLTSSCLLSLLRPPPHLSGPMVFLAWFTVECLRLPQNSSVYTECKAYAGGLCSRFTTLYLQVSELSGVNTNAYTFQICICKQNEANKACFFPFCNHGWLCWSKIPVIKCHICYLCLWLSLVFLHGDRSSRSPSSSDEYEIDFGEVNTCTQENGFGKLMASCSLASFGALSGEVRDLFFYAQSL